jgi:uncharacterized protein
MRDSPSSPQPAEPQPGARRRKVFVLVVLAAVLGVTLFGMRERLLSSMLFFPMRGIDETPAALGLAFEELEINTEDGERLHAWWIPAQTPGRRLPAIGHLLYFHGNAGTIEYRLMRARSLTGVGFDVLLFDYRGYGRSTGAPSESGTYRDGRAALQALRARKDVDPARVFYYGESLGGAVAVELATATAPRGLILQSTFTSVRGMARFHYPIVPALLVLDAYPSERRLAQVKAPVLVIHGDRDTIVPLAEGQALFAAAREPKTMHVVKGAGHNDLDDVMGESYGRVVAEWASGLP